MIKLEIGKEEIRHLAQSLRKFSFFSDLTMSDLDKVLNVTNLYSYKGGKYVFKKGVVGDALYVVHQGEVKVLKKTLFFLPGKEIARLGPGNIFGEMALINQPYRTASIKTIGPTKLFVLLSSNFNALLRDNPSFKKSISQMADLRKI